MTRDETYGFAAKKLTECKRLICQWATGTGKSQVALRFISCNNFTKCLIVVPETDNIKNWRFEFKKFGVSDVNVKIICYASLHKYRNTKWDFLVLDEMPHIDTDKRKQSLGTIEADYILALGALITDDERESLESIYGEFIKSSISIEQAIERNLLPIPRVNVMHLKLDNNKHYWYNGSLVTQKEHCRMLDEKVDAAVKRHENHRTELNRRKMLALGNERKRFLGEAKTQKVRDICDILNAKKKRFLCFCSSIAQTVTVGKDCSFTSETPATKKLLEKFNSKEINSLYVVGKLIEGQNLVDIDCGIIVQLGGTERITVQEIGRILRSENPVVYILVFDNTKDDSFLYTLTRNIPKEYIKHYNF